MPLDALLGRVAHEWETRSRVFDLMSARIWKPDPEIDLSFDFLGRRAATPIGPAAGPHTQMTQNIVLAWLGGSRVFELKTVQVIDDLDIARPCIDMETIGYNIEWSQELAVPESIDEYVKAWMMIDILKRWEPLSDHLGPDPGPMVFDMSVGYDLEGISSDKVRKFIEAMKDSSSRIEALRSQIPEPFGEFRHLEFDPAISDTLTLSTFHGCPPDEIDAIVRYLMREHELDVIVKLNPTLLGFGAVESMLHDTLGYDEVIVTREAFEADLQFDRAVDLIGELGDYADSLGRQFGIKLSNTLVVSNHKGFMPDETMYLSGPPLHVISSTILDMLVTALPGVFDLPGQAGTRPVSFSAGVRKENLASTIAMGVGPATMCTDLLKPGGYGRLKPMLKALTSEVADGGHTDLASWQSARFEEAKADGHRDWTAKHVADVVGVDIGLYNKEGNAKLPRAVDVDLQMWGCTACNLCVTVCPNDAFVKLPSPVDLADQIGGRWQYLVFAELCNECGNCMTFCPEDGDPAQIKPKLWTTEDRFANATGQGFRLVPDKGAIKVVASDGWDSQVDILASVIAGDQGVPIRATDI
jgi:putative selenate reductase